MIVTIKNFKCIIEAKINLLDNTIILIKAPSGFGKSSLFEAIFFVFFGNRSTDFVTYGKKKCQVSVELNDFIITRTKNPNSVSVVSKKQGVIDNAEEFIKNNFKMYPLNFATLNSNKQMQILENICTINDNLDVNKLKNHLKFIHQESLKEMKKLQIDLEVNKKLIEKLPTHQENITMPNSIIKIDSIKNLTKKLTKLEIEKDNFLSEKAQKDYVQNSINNIEKDIKNYTFLSVQEEELLKLNILEYKDVLKKHENLKKTNYNQHENITEDELSILKLELENLNLEKLQNEKIINQINQQLKKINNSDITIKNLNEIKLIEGNETITNLSCPECGIHLQLLNNKLEKLILTQKSTDSEIIKTCLNLKKQLVKNNDERLDFLKKKIEMGENYFKNKFLYQQCDEIIKKTNISLIEDKLKKNDHYKTLILQLNKFYKEKENFKNIQIDEEKLKKDIIFIKTQIEKVKNYENDLSKWQLNEEIKNKKETICEEIKTLSLKFEKLIKIIETIESLKSCIEESESLSIISLIDCINQNIKIFTNDFFTEDITVKLQEFHEVQSTKSIKSQVDIMIYYKGKQMKLSNLSSGEHARVQLAIDLSIYKILKTNIPLLLDEVTANLDSDISTHIFSVIKSHFKSVVIVAHQAIEGVFDNVITEYDLEKYFKKM